MGGALGVGVLGASLGVDLSARLSGTSAIDASAALRPETQSQLAPDALRAVQSALGGALQNVFLEMLVMAALIIGCSFGLRGGRAVSGNQTEDRSRTRRVEDEPRSVGAEF